MVENKEFPCLTTKDFNKLEQSQKSIIDMRFNTDLQSIITEWGITCDGFEVDKLPDDLAERYSRVSCCELCGQKGLRFIYVITNKVSKKSLFVGSSCIEMYDQIRNSSGTSAKDLVRENRKKQKIRMNEEKILQKCSNVLTLIRRFRNFENENDLLLKDDLEKKYDVLKEQVDAYDRIINQVNISDKKIEEIEVILKDLEKFFKAYDLYKQNSDIDDFGITKEITEYCRNFLQTDSILNKIKKLGKIPFEAISLIKEPKFMSKMMLKFEPLLNQNGLTLIRKNLGRKFSYLLGNGITLETDSNDFISEYCDYIKDDSLISGIDFYKLISKSNINNNSYSKALSLIDFTGLNKHSLKQVFSDTKIGEISFRYKNSFYVVDYKSFIDLFKHQLVDEKFEENDYKNMADYIKKYGTDYSYFDYRNYLKKYGIDIKNIT